MTFDAIPAGADVFVDANTLIYHFADDGTYGAACTRLIERIEQGDLRGHASADVVSDTAHRMMTIEAIECFGWPIAGIATRLRNNPLEVSKLSRYQQAVQILPQLGIKICEVNLDLVLAATGLSRQYGLLSGDALVVAVMQAHGWTVLASRDTDFDRVSDVTRYSPT